MATHYNTKPIVTDDLVFYFDPGNIKSYPGNGSILYDLSKNSNNATLNGVSFISDFSGSFEFEPYPILDYIVTDNIIDFSANWTVLAWVTITEDIKYTHILTSTDGQSNFSCKIDEAINNKKPYFYSTSGRTFTSYTGDPLTPGTMYQLGYSYNGSELRIYVNGQMVNSGSATLNSTPSTLKINGGHSSEYASFTGGCFYFYSRALSDVEITQNFNALRGRYGI